MAIVSLVISRTETGSEIDDSLAGGSTGVDFGTVPNNGSSNTQSLYLRHDGANIITELSLYIQQYAGVYGGAFTASDDFSKMLALGDAVGDYGLHYDEDWNNNTPFSTFYKFKTGVGDAYATRRVLQTTSILYYNTTTTQKSDPTSPVAGIVAENSNSADAISYGNRALIRQRVKLPASEIEGGIRQWSTVLAYVYTS